MTQDPKTTDTSREAVEALAAVLIDRKSCNTKFDQERAANKLVVLLAERDALRAQLAAAKDLPWRAKDIKRGLILFRTSSNAHGSINYQARSEKVDNLPQSAKDELAAIMVNMALGYSPEEVAANGVVKEWVAAARNEALEEVLNHFEPDCLDGERTRSHCEYAQREILALKSTTPAPREVTVQEAAK